MHEKNEERYEKVLDNEIANREKKLERIEKMAKWLYPIGCACAGISLLLAACFPDIMLIFLIIVSIGVIVMLCGDMCECYTKGCYEARYLSILKSLKAIEEKTKCQDKD